MSSCWALDHWEWCENSCENLCRLWKFTLTFLCWTSNYHSLKLSKHDKFACSTHSHQWEAIWGLMKRWRANSRWVSAISSSTLQAKFLWDHEEIAQGYLEEIFSIAERYERMWKLIDSLAFDDESSCSITLIGVWVCSEELALCRERLEENSSFHRVNALKEQLE